MNNFWFQKMRGIELEIGKSVLCGVWDKDKKVMVPKENNFAYIDGANLHNGIYDFGWKLDYARFKVWLREKYVLKTAYNLIGLIPKYKEL